MMRKPYMITILPAALALMVASGVSYARDVEFNQGFIEARWAGHGGWTVPERPDGQESPSGGSSPPASPRNDARFDDPASVLSFLWRHIPDHAIVYPTETYYYYRFDLRDRRVSGNLRFVDIADGVLRIGYFDANDTSDTRSSAFDASSGCTVETINDNTYRVTYDGRTIEFVLPTKAKDITPAFDLLDEEELVTGVLDESGIAFHLLYNTRLHAFYYVLDEQMPAADLFVPVEVDGRFLVGRESRFVLYNDGEHERKLLVGVLGENIRQNNYYDGPFDQVPPRLPLKEKLEAAYPYVTYRGGIDEHGNFREIEAQRVAISPYQGYQHLHELVNALADIADSQENAPDQWLAMTYESKRDFHLQLTNQTAGNQSGEPIWYKQGWPANHWGKNSQQWPADHDRNDSLLWEPNFIPGSTDHDDSEH